MNPLDRFIAPAIPKRNWWRILLGLVVVIALWLVGTIVVLLAYTLVNIADSGDPDAALLVMEQIMDGGDPVAILVMLLTFLGVWLGVFFTSFIIHQRPFMTLFAPDHGIYVGQFMRGFLLALAFAGISILLSIVFVGAPAPDLSGDRWAVFIVPLLAFVFIQATAEELIFRGYLLQQLGALSRNWLVWAVIPSLLFGLIHYNSDLPNYGGVYYVLITFLMGLAFSVLVWRTGTLWAAAGLHVGINIMGLGVVGTEGILAGTQLWLFEKDDMIGLMQLDLLVTIALLAFVISPLAPFSDVKSESREEAVFE